MTGDARAGQGALAHGDRPNLNEKEVSGTTMRSAAATMWLYLIQVGAALVVGNLLAKRIALSLSYLLWQLSRF